METGHVAGKLTPRPKSSEISEWRGVEVEKRLSPMGWDSRDDERDRCC